MPSREQYQVTGTTVEELRVSLNFVLQQISDRLDRLEGIRGKRSIATNGVTAYDDDDELIHAMGE